MDNANSNGKKNQIRTDEQEVQPPAKDNLVETKHSVTINGERIAYTVTCGTIILKEESEKQAETKGESEGEKPKASIFFVAYTRDDVSDKSKRPVTFTFNGGPGSSSVWLHLGALSPRRVLMDEMGNTLPPPYRLVENEYSIFDKTDLVFIDPVSTGFSRVIPGEKAKEFHGFTKDIQSVGDFIYLFTSRYNRWSSPKFLAGESYGTTRAAGLSGYLQNRHGMYLNGIMLLSSVLNFQTLQFVQGNDLPYILFLPTYAAAAWYHQRLPEDLQSDLRKTLDEVEVFAFGEYTRALMMGTSLPAPQREEIIAKLVRYTGLSPEYIDHTNLRIEIHRFTKELLRDQHYTVGRLDSRFKGVDMDRLAERSEYDPSLTNITGPYTAMFNHYVRHDLEFTSDLPYEILTPRVYPWSYAEHENRFVDVADTLRRAMTINPYLKVFVANGFYDLATPYFATQYTFNHMNLEPDLQANLSMAYYEAGHMMYIHARSMAMLKEDLSNFTAGAILLKEA